METELPQEAIVTVDIEASPDEVWHAITTSDGFSSWIGDGSTIGGEVGDDVTANDIVTGDRKVGYVDQVEPGEHLGYRWWSEGDRSTETSVGISLEPCETGTRVTVIETPATPGTAVMASASTTAGSWAWRSALLVLAMPAFCHVGTALRVR